MVEVAPEMRLGPGVVEQREPVGAGGTAWAIATVPSRAATTWPQAGVVHVTCRGLWQLTLATYPTARFTGRLESVWVHAAQQACASWAWLDAHEGKKRVAREGGLRACATACSRHPAFAIGLACGLQFCLMRPL